MALRKSIVFFGAVLVLAACDRATAPTGPLSLHDGPAASARKDSSRSTTMSTTTTSSMTEGCVWWKGGDGDSTLVCEQQIQ
jgi:hypothetical protein